MGPKRFTLILAAVFVLATSGCTHLEIQAPARPSPDPPLSQRVDLFLWGLIAPDKVEVAEKECGGPLVQVKTRVKGWHGAVTIMTFGLYAPQEKIIECPSKQSTSS